MTDNVSIFYHTSGVTTSKVLTKQLNQKKKKLVGFFLICTKSNSFNSSNFDLKQTKSLFH